MARASFGAFLAPQVPSLRLHWPLATDHSSLVTRQSPLFWLFRKTCTIRRSREFASACKRTHTPRAASQTELAKTLRTISTYSEFTTGLPDWKLTFRRWSRQFPGIFQRAVQL